jgi:CRP-like cAMP-binding protein
LNERQYTLFKVIQKIEIFAGFDHTDVQRLLKICRFQNYALGDAVYARGASSDEMMILLRGKMLVLGTDGKELARLGPGHPMGEMGLFTGQPRSADVVAGDKSTGLVLRRSDLSLMLGGNREMMVKVLENVVGVLSARLEDTNSLVAAQGRTIHDLEKRLQEYEPPDTEIDDDDSFEEESYDEDDDVEDDDDDEDED